VGYELSHGQVERKDVEEGFLSRLKQEAGIEPEEVVTTDGSPLYPGTLKEGSGRKLPTSCASSMRVSS
jgi:hypothetical protein